MYKATRNFRAKCTTGGGFTLAELLIVVAVIAVLVAVAVPTFGNQLEKSRQTTDVSNLRGAYAAARLAELNGGIGDENGVVKIFERPTTQIKNDGSMDISAATEAEKIYALYYWYDPATGLLEKAAAAASANDDADYPVTKFDKDRRGSAQSGTVVAETGGLAGSGQKTVVYTATELNASAKVGKAYTLNNASTTAIKAGTVDKSIRVAFVENPAGVYKLHEIAYVGSSGAPFHNKYVAKAETTTVTLSTTALSTSNTDDAVVVNLTSADIPEGATTFDFTDFITPTGGTGALTYTKTQIDSADVSSDTVALKVNTGSTTKFEGGTTANVQKFMYNGGTSFNGIYQITIDIKDATDDHFARVQFKIDMNK